MHEDTEGQLYSQPWCCHFPVMRNVYSAITDSSNDLLSSVRSRAGEVRRAGFRGNMGAVRLGRKTWGDTLVWTLEKSVIPETQADKALLPAFLDTSKLFHFWLPFFGLVMKPWARGSATSPSQVHLTCPSLPLPRCTPRPSPCPHSTSLAQVRVPGRSIPAFPPHAVAHHTSCSLSLVQAFLGSRSVAAPPHPQSPSATRIPHSASKWFQCCLPSSRYPSQSHC